MQQHAGTSLIEILISFLLLSTLLLGLDAMQLISLRALSRAYQETVSAQQIANQSERQCAGLALVELLLAMTLGLILLHLLFALVLANEQSTKWQANLTNIQLNASIASNLLTQEIHQAGYLGCVSLAANIPWVADSRFAITPHNKLVGQHNALTIRHAGYPLAVLKKTLATDRLLVSGYQEFKVGDLLIIADCQHAEIVKVVSIAKRKSLLQLKIVPALHNLFAPMTEISRLEINTFYFNAAKHALMKQTWRGVKTAVVDGIAEMQLAYTVHGNSHDLSAEQVSDWSKVVGVAVDLTFIAASLHKQWHLYAKVGM